MDKLPEWITAVATAITTLGVLLLWKQVRADHERSRRENAIKYLFEWSRGLSQSNSLARKLAETLDENQARDLVNSKPLTMPSDKKNWILACLTKSPHGGLTEKNGEIELGETEVADIRWQVVHYLNLLESVFTAARHNVADKEILKEQFRYLISDKEGYRLLGRVRAALGGAEAYPAIAEMQKILEQERQPPPGKPPLAK